MAKGTARKFRLDSDDEETFDMQVSKNIRKREINRERRNKDLRYQFITQGRVTDIL